MKGNKFSIDYHKHLKYLWNVLQYIGIGLNSNFEKVLPGSRNRVKLFARVIMRIKNTHTIR